MEDDPAEKDDDFEVDLEAVDVVSFALAVVSLGFNALVSDSMSVATVLGMSFTDGQANYLKQIYAPTVHSLAGVNVVSSQKKSQQQQNMVHEHCTNGHRVQGPTTPPTNTHPGH